MDGDDCQCEEGAPAWMATFSDLATLLLTFFVLLLSFANMDIQSFHEVLGSVKSALGVKSAEPGMVEAVASTPVILDTAGSPHISLDEKPGILMTQMQGKLKEAGLEDEVEIESTPRGLVLRIKDRVLFAVGSDVLADSAKPLLGVVTDLAREFPQDIAIEGHTDDRPIKTKRFPSNWELSTSRATSVLRALRDGGIEVRRLSVAGYADTRPVADNETAENRQRNRRVEFIFLNRQPNDPKNAVDADGAKPSILAPEQDALQGEVGTETGAQQGQATDPPTGAPLPSDDGAAQGNGDNVGRDRDAHEEMAAERGLDSLQGKNTATRRLPDGRVRQFLVPMGSQRTE